MNLPKLIRVVATLALLSLALGCASSKVQGKRSFVGGTAMPRPPRVLVYDFRADLSKVKDSKRREQRELFDEARDALAEQLVTRIRTMGLMARRAGRDMKPIPDELVVDGEFVSIDKGNRFTRNVIGFGVGATEMVAQVQVLRGRADTAGMQLVFDYRAVSKGSKKPGIATPIGMGATAVAAVSGAVGVVGEVKGPVAQDAIRMADVIADDLGSFFVEQGWVPQEALEE
jgi:hypothetical protein